MLPLSRVRLAGGLVQWQHAAPAGTYGGWLSADGEPVQAEDLGHVLSMLADTGVSTTFRWFPFSGGGMVHEGTSQTNMDPMRSSAPDQQDTASVTSEVVQKATHSAFSAADSLPGVVCSKLPSGWSHTPEYTRVLDCSMGYGAIVQQWQLSRSAMMRNLRKAERSGVQVRWARSPEDRNAYHALYQDAARTWTPAPAHVYGHRLWDILAEYEPHTRLWLAEYNGRIIAGAVLLYGVNHVAYWHGASDAGQRGVRPVNLLLAKAIEDACERGYRWFDFNPGGSLQGVDRFKASFGAVRVACPLYERQTLAGSLCMRASRLRQSAEKRLGRSGLMSRGDT